MMKRFKYASVVRAFFAGAMVTAAVVELVTAMPPLGQMTISAAAGLLTVFASKVGAAAIA